MDKADLRASQVAPEIIIIPDSPAELCPELGEVPQRPLAPPAPVEPTPAQHRIPLPHIDKTQAMTGLRWAAAGGIIAATAAAVYAIVAGLVWLTGVVTNWMIQVAPLVGLVLLAWLVLGWASGHRRPGRATSTEYSRCAPRKWAQRGGRFALIGGKVIALGAIMLVETVARVATGRTVEIWRRTVDPASQLTSEPTYVPHGLDAPNYPLQEVDSPAHIPSNSPGKLTRPAAIAEWLFGPEEAPSANIKQGRRSSTVDRSFSSWLYDPEMALKIKSGVPIPLEYLTDGLTARWCDRMRNAGDHEEARGVFRRRRIVRAPQLCAVGFLFDEYNPEGWYNAGVLFGEKSWCHVDQEELYRRYGLDFLQSVSERFEDGWSLNDCANYVEQHFPR